MKPRLRILTSLAAVLMAGLTACSSLPRDVRGDVDVHVNLPALRDHVYEPQGQLVRWGGLIARVQNKDNQSWIEIVEKPLDSFGRPMDANRTGGRFMAVVDRFLDPMIYAQGREITVTGALQPSINGRIDEQDYQFFVVAASGYHLWDGRPVRDYDRVYFIHNSWWDPWWYTPAYYYRPWYYNPGHPVVIPREPHNRPGTTSTVITGGQRDPQAPKETLPQIHPVKPGVTPPEPRVVPRVEPKVQTRSDPPPPPKRRDDEDRKKGDKDKR